MDRLIKEIKSLGVFTESELEQFVEAFEEVSVKKGEYILREGQVCRHLS